MRLKSNFSQIKNIDFFFTCALASIEIGVLCTRDVPVWVEGNKKKNAFHREKQKHL